MHKKIRTAVCIVAFLGMLGALAAVVAQETSPSGVELLGKVGGGNNGNNGGGNGGNNGGGNGGDNGNNGGGNGGDNGNNGGGGGNNGNNGGGNGGGGDNGNNGNNGGGNGGGDNGNSGNGGGGGGGTANIRGRGLRQHGAALRSIVKRYGLRSAPHSTNVSGHASAMEEARVHEAACAMFRYLHQMKEVRPNLRVDYVEWITEQSAEMLGIDPVTTKAMMLGFPHMHDHLDTIMGMREISCVTLPGGPQSEQTIVEEHGTHEHSTHTSAHFMIEDRSTPEELAFTVMQDGAVFTEYGVSHTKEMHLLIVRNDLRHFSHLHPELGSDGIWRVPYAAPAGGTYWLYADFVDQENAHHTIRFDRTNGGDPGATGYAPSAQRYRRSGAYDVHLETEAYDGGKLFTYTINDDNGKVPIIEPYLGAMAHGILISPNGDFIHTHPSPVGDHIVLHLPAHLEGYYRIFTQFQIEGELHTVEFDWIP